MIEKRTQRIKLIDKQIVEATKPTIYIGKRTYTNKHTGDVHVAKPYWAEYFANGRQCGFQNPQQYKVHTFRHFFASYCAQQNLSYKYVLEWMGHSSSAILDMYFTMNDRHALAAMNGVSFEGEKAESRTLLGQSGPHFQEALPQPTHS